ncbi:glycosyltransferase family 2 protein [Thioclava sp. BHET1]|nr:glycosyltransferase family 2 protein [Thioclava sp. BHET1]
MPRASIVVPAYNTEATLKETLLSLLAQSFSDLEIIVVDDGSAPASAAATAAIVASLADPRLRLVVQANRGLAGARNSGIHHARGSYIGFCDGDDLWLPGKLAAHVAHLDACPEVGISYSGSALIDAQSRLLRSAQRPRLRGVDAGHIFRRNPIGNGSAPVIRRAALAEIAYRPMGEAERDWIFDESFRQSEDIECWLRMALTTDWGIAGIPGLWTRYRIVAGGLSAGTERQFGAWERMVAKLTPLAPAFMARSTPAARAYQLRYLARRAISARDGRKALGLLRRALSSSLRPLWEEPVKTGVTLAAAAVLALPGARIATKILSARLLARRIA